jgi:predicted transcriptional regulator
VEAGIRDAREDMEVMILDATLFELSERERQFLVAMTKDQDSSDISAIASRLSISASNASHYKRRLVDRGILAETGRGKVTFAMPLLKSLLLQRFD